MHKQPSRTRRHLSRGNAAIRAGEARAKTYVTGSIMRTDVLEHPAVKAWIKLQPDRVEPESIEILDGKKRVWIKLQSERAEPESIETLDRKKRAWIKFRSERFQPEVSEFLERRRFTYRLKGVGREGSAVIAKQCKRGAGMLQHAIYKKIFARLPVPTLCCYGFVEE